MKKFIFPFIFLTSFCVIHAQQYDLVVTTRSDSIACRIDSITDSRLFFSVRHGGKWMPTFLDKEKVMDYQIDVLDKKSIRHKSHASSDATLAQSSSDTISKTSIRKNSLYYELFGNGLFFGSVNYDRILPVDRKFYMVIRGGLAFYEKPFLLAEVSGLFGSRKHFFDTGIGSSTFFIINGDSPEIFLHAGYRFQGKNGLLLRVTPMYCLNKNFIWFGLSAGYSF
jgi:hypothetical protein